MSEISFEQVRPDIAFLVGPTHEQLGLDVAKELGVEPVPLEFKRFPDTEPYTRITENVGGQIAIPFNTHAPVDGLPVESAFYTSLQMTDAAKRGRAREVIFVAPTYAGARQDSQYKKREAVSAFLNADLIQASGADSAYFVDLHDSHVLHHLAKSMPADQFTMQRELASRLGDLISGDRSKYVMVAPDKGHKENLEKRAAMLGVDLTALAKGRDRTTGMVTHDATGLLDADGEPIDITGRTVLLMDDMLSTGDTHISAAESLQEIGVGEQYLAVTHAWFLKDAVKRLAQSPFVKIFVSDTIPIDPQTKKILGKRLEVVSSAQVIANGLKKVLTGGSVSELDPDPEDTDLPD